MLNILLGHGFELGHHLLVLVFNHFVLSLLCSQCSFQVCDSDADGLIGNSVGLGQLVLLHVFDFDADLVLRLDVFEVSLHHGDGHFTIVYPRLVYSIFGGALLALDVPGYHLLMDLLYLVLMVEDTLFQLFLFLQGSNYLAVQLL